MKRVRRAVALVAAALLSFVGAPGVRAQKPEAGARLSADERAEYRELVREALQEYDLGHWEEARSLMLAAHELSPSARTLRGLGMVAFERRDYVEAADLLERALEDERKPLTETQRAAVQELLERTRHFLGRYRLDVEPEHPEDTQVYVDGAPAQLDSRGRVVLVAGEHELVVEAPEVGRQALVLDVRGGEEVTLTVRLEREQSPEQATVHKAAPSRTIESNRPYRGWGLGLGTAGLSMAAAGAVVGGVALGQAGSAEADQGSEADSARAMARAADALLAVGGAAALTGLSLWLVRGERKSDGKHAGLGLSPLAAPRGGGLRLSGSF